MRNLYSFVWWLILPFALARLWWRGKKEPGYRKHISERLAIYPPSSISGDCTWIHAVSVGETRAAEPLINSLLQAYPDRDILLTCMTPTGRITGESLFAHTTRVKQVYLPYDTGFMMKRFIRHFRPGICILMETEVWPNLIAQCDRQKIPVALVNARLSQRSLEKGKRLSSLIQEAANRISCVAAQTETDAKRLRQFGTHNVAVAGSVKFDATPPPDAVKKGIQLRSSIGNRPVLICASTRDGEESIILDAFTRLAPANTLLIIVPRHPQRFDEIAGMISSKNLSMIRRSQLGADFFALKPISTETQVLLGDSMGEMFMYYAASDLAFIGGSLQALGGQNLIEACALGKPVLVGPHTYNFEAITEDAVKAGAALRVYSADELMQAANLLLLNQDKLAVMGEKARLFASLQRGATEKTIALLKPLLAGHQTSHSAAHRES